MSRDSSFAVCAVRTSHLVAALFMASLAAGCGGGGAAPGDDDDVEDCVPRTCESRGFNCGATTDGCGHPLDCGTCAAPATCGGLARTTSVVDEDAVGPIVGSGPDNVWSFVRGGRMQQWNGQAWKARAPLRTLGEAQAIHGTGPSDIWVATDTGVLHWNGGGWFEPKMGTSLSDDVTGVYAASPTEVWVTSSFHDAIYRFDGAGFVEAFSTGSVDLYGIHGASATDLWAVGKAGQAVHSDGTTWTPQPTGGDASLNAV